MPFITEELWHFCGNRSKEEALVVSVWPEVTGYDNELLTNFESLQQLIGAIRHFRKEKKLGFKDPITLYVGQSHAAWTTYQTLVEKLGFVSDLYYKQPDENRVGGTFRVAGTEFFVPLEGKMDLAAERQKIQEELQYAKGFLASVDKKLSNERFVNNAPEAVVAMEQKKAADAQQKIAILEESLKKLPSD